MRIPLRPKTRYHVGSGAAVAPVLARPASGAAVARSQFEV